MPDDLASPGVALALVVAFVLALGSASILQARHDPDRSAGVCIIVLVLTLTMAVSVLALKPLRAGDLVEERQLP